MATFSMASTNARRQGVRLRQVWYDFRFGRQRARYVRLSFDKISTAKGTGMFIDDVEVTR